MKSDVMPSIVRMEAEVLRQLVTEIRETVAMDYNMAKVTKTPSFGVVDLWNIQRKMKSARRLSRRVEL